MGIRMKAARILMMIVGIVALLFAIRLNQYEKVIEFLTGFKKYELAGYGG